MKQNIQTKKTNYKSNAQYRAPCKSLLKSGNSNHVFFVDITFVIFVIVCEKNSIELLKLTH